MQFIVVPMGDLHVGMGAQHQPVILTMPKESWLKDSAMGRYWWSFGRWQDGILRGTLGAAPLILMAVWVWHLSSWLISKHSIWNFHSSQDSFTNREYSALLWDKYLIRMRVKTLFCPRTPRRPFTPMKSARGSLMPMQKRQESEF